MRTIISLSARWLRDSLSSRRSRRQRAICRSSSAATTRSPQARLPGHSGRVMRAGSSLRGSSGWTRTRTSTRPKRRRPETYTGCLSLLSSGSTCLGSLERWAERPGRSTHREWPTSGSAMSTQASG
eukprot:Amastigsp_a844256_9.p2 type:complete len:126 gc:universal Amastigsp_a844256_9:361-738(+)